VAASVTVSLLFHLARGTIWVPQRESAIEEWSRPLGILREQVFEVIGDARLIVRREVL
jgi:hypothetical protein